MVAFISFELPQTSKPYLSRHMSVKPKLMKRARTPDYLPLIELPNREGLTLSSVSSVCSHSPIAWSELSSSAQVEEDSGIAFSLLDDGIEVTKQRHRDQFLDQEIRFLRNELPSTYRKVLRSADEPFSPCSCTILQAYSTVYEMNDDDECEEGNNINCDDQKDRQLLVSRDPYICTSCWHAYCQGQADRMIYQGLEGGLRLKRTYFDFQDRPLLTVTIERGGNNDNNTNNKESQPIY